MFTISQRGHCLNSKLTFKKGCYKRINKLCMKKQNSAGAFKINDKQCLLWEEWRISTSYATFQSMLVLIVLLKLFQHKQDWGYTMPKEQRKPNPLVPNASIIVKMFLLDSLDRKRLSELPHFAMYNACPCFVLIVHGLIIPTVCNHCTHI